MSIHSTLSEKASDNDSVGYSDIFLAYASENGTSTGVVENYRKLCLFVKRPKVDIMALRLIDIKGYWSS